MLLCEAAGLSAAHPPALPRSVDDWMCGPSLGGMLVGYGGRVWEGQHASTLEVGWHGPIGPISPFADMLVLYAYIRGSHFVGL